MINQLRDWINRYQQGPFLLVQLLVMTPVMIAMSIAIILAGGPWWMGPIIAAGLALIMAWIFLVSAAVTKWFGR